MCQFSTGDDPTWLIGLDCDKIKKSFCLEMMEIILQQYFSIFAAFGQFNFLLKEQVCNIIIASFSPKFTKQSDKNADEIQNFVISTRILKIVAILLENYNAILKTESEIFLSFLIKFLDGEKWQRAIAVEGRTQNTFCYIDAVFRICVQNLTLFWHG